MEAEEEEIFFEINESTRNYFKRLFNNFSKSYITQYYEYDQILTEAKVKNPKPLSQGLLSYPLITDEDKSNPSFFDDVLCIHVCGCALSFTKLT